ncbi:MAG: ATP-binding protein [Magnetococcales bacterium]|nr:ATP-binding protein [Magnetococcales bacterium]
MTTLTLRPWSDLVPLHPDVEEGKLTEAVFAIDLGAIASGDPNTPIVNRDPDAFFRATYLTTDLARLLSEVLAALSGQSGLDRVLKLRTPFGGGKSHTLASLLHAARKRSALNLIPEAAGFPDPGPVATAVFDGEKFDALQGKRVSPEVTVRTMWGWIAWQIDPENAFPLVADHDRDRVAPGGDVIRSMLTEGASGRPVLILLDEVLKYMERASAVPVLESTLQRQAKDFFQNLTVEVAGSAKAALAYSLTWSSRESLGNVALLEEIDKLAARVDQQREPVSGDEILPILQRRLLARAPDPQTAAEVAEAFQDKIASLWRAQAEGLAERRHVDEDANLLRERLKAAYPFHPALIDLMQERWTAVEAFQRTRGALRFLASCLHALKKNGGAQALLGPGDIPIKDAEVRLKLLKELGAQNDYDPVIVADIVGPNARARRIDDRLAACRIMCI